MPLPELQTQGPDITNTLLKIEQLKSSRLNQEHLQKQNALLDLQKSPEMLALAKTKALQEIQSHREEAEKRAVDRQKEIIGMISNYIAKINPDIPGDYERAVKFMTEDERLKARPDLFPSSEVFLKEDINSPNGKKFDKEMFFNWQKTATRTAADLQKDPTKDMDEITVYRPDGTSFKQFVSKSSGVFDPEKIYGKGWSTSAPKETKEPVETWGKEETLPSGESRQVSSRGKINVITKPEKADKPKQVSVQIYKVDDPNQTATDWAVEGKRYTPPAGWKQVTSERVLRTTTGGTAAPAKVKSIMQAKDGTTLYVMDKGPVRIAVTDDTGQMVLKEAGLEYQKEVATPPRAAGEFEKSVAEALKDNKDEKKADRKQYLKRAVNAQGVEIGWTGTQWEDVKTGKVYR